MAERIRLSHRNQFTGRTKSLWVVERRAQNPRQCQGCPNTIEPGDLYWAGQNAEAICLGCPSASVVGRRLLVVRFDVTGWPEHEIAALELEAAAQGEASDEYTVGDPETGHRAVATQDERVVDDDPLGQLRDAVREVADFRGMGYQDEPWWPEAVALHRKLGAQ